MSALSCEMCGSCIDTDFVFWTPGPQRLKFTHLESRRIYGIFQTNVLLPEVIQVSAAAMMFGVVVAAVACFLSSDWQLALMLTGIVGAAAHLLAIALYLRAPKNFQKLRYIIRPQQWDLLFLITHQVQKACVRADNVIIHYDLVATIQQSKT